MLAIFLCIAAFAICFMRARRSLPQGTAAMLGVGYAYGIVRARIPEPASHFIFDAGLLGLYLGAWSLDYDEIQLWKIRKLWPWLGILAVWPLLLFIIPIQDPLIQLVGLRGVTFFLPIVLFGALMTNEDLYTLALWVAVLNLIVFAVGVGEFFLGVKLFMPHVVATDTIYNTHDVGSTFALRIPSTFVASAAYGATMVMTMPLLVGAWLQAKREPWMRNLLFVALIASVVSVFLSASRTQAAIMIFLAVILTLTGRLPVRNWLAWVIIIGSVAYVISTSDRLQRFTELQDTNMVGERIKYSVQTDLIGLAEEYPMGNGLGGGGTSIPYFLRDRLKDPVYVENEYARILLEEGAPGLLLWLGFIAWVMTRKRAESSEAWYVARHVGWFLCLAFIVQGPIGTGMLTSIPGTALLMFYFGWIAAEQPPALALEQEPQDEGEWAMSEGYQR